MPRGRSAYNQFVSSRMRSRRPQGLAESRAAMREIASEWRSLHGRRNPGGGGLGTLLVVGAVGYFGYQYLKKHPGVFGTAPAASAATTR